MQSAIQINGLTKKFGQKIALNELNMTVPKNTVYGFLGENGAGKTTTFSILGGFLPSFSGTFKINGSLGMLPQDARFGVGRSIGSQLKLLARLSGVATEEVDKEVRRVLNIVNMTDDANLSLEKCSHGMYKRIGIAQALLGNPDILLFDEPTAGLDPKNAHDIRKLIAELNHNKTVVISSHNLAEIEEICDHVGIINQGKMVYEGPVSDLVKESSVVNLELTQKPDLEELKKLEGITSVKWLEESQTCQVEFDPKKISPEEANQQLLKYLLKKKIGLRSLTSGRHLEQEYLERIV